MNVPQYKNYDSRRIGLILPTYDKTSFNRLSVVNFAQQFPDAKIVEISSSCLGHCFNVGYQSLMKLVHAGEVDYIAMLHADVVPVQAKWGEILFDEVLATGADLLSVVIPIKSQYGLTSTAVFKEEDFKANVWNPIRFTMKEVFQMSETFTHPRLAVNTGCMVIDARKDWAQKIVFDLRCLVDLKNYRSWYIPEDWLMSRACIVGGGKIYATRKVQVEHFGNLGFPNTQAWGAVASEGAMEIFLQEGGVEHGK